MDAFSEILTGVKLNGALFFNAGFSAPWCSASPACQQYVWGAALEFFHFRYRKLQAKHDKELVDCLQVSRSLCRSSRRGPDGRVL